MKNKETANLGSTFLTALALILVPSILVFKIFSFEIGVIFAICFSASAIITAIVGLENIVIQK